MSLALSAPAPSPEPPSTGLDLRAAPPSAAWHATVAALESGDAKSWAVLMPSLRALANRMAPSFSDVVSAEDVLGELALLAHERWLPEYVGRARRGDARVSVETFLRDRLRDHLRELRRRQLRRAALLAPLDGAPLFVALPPRPDEALEAAELERNIAPDKTARTLLTLRVAGYDQSEIAEATKTSRPTVSRRLAAIAALLVGLGLLLLAAAQWRARDLESIAAEPGSTEGTAPATAGESADPTPAEEGNDGADTSSGEPRAPESPPSDLLDPWSDTRVPREAERTEGAPRRSSDDLLDPFEGLRVPGPFRTDDARTPRAHGSDLLDPFANPRSSTSDAPRTTRASRPRPRSAARSEGGRSSDLIDPFAARETAGETNPASPSRPSASTERGVLVVNALPWAEVLVDGRSVGNTPLTGHMVEAGRHTLELRFSNGAVRRMNVDVEAGRIHRIVHRADAP